jgi:hypothetical protein
VGWAHLYRKVGISSFSEFASSEATLQEGSRPASSAILSRCYFRRIVTNPLNTGWYSCVDSNTDLFIQRKKGKYRMMPATTAKVPIIVRGRKFIGECVYNVTQPPTSVGRRSRKLCLIAAAARTAIPCCTRARTFPEEPCILLGIRDEMMVSPSEALPALRKMIRGRQAR